MRRTQPRRDLGRAQHLRSAWSPALSLPKHHLHRRNESMWPGLGCRGVEVLSPSTEGQREASTGAPPTEPAGGHGGHVFNPETKCPLLGCLAAELNGALHPFLTFQASCISSG